MSPRSCCSFEQRVNAQVGQQLADSLEALTEAANAVEPHYGVTPLLRVIHDH